MEWIFRYALGKRRKKAFIKRLISAFHKSFSVFGFWPLTFDLWLFFLLFPPALNVPADFIVSTNICFYGGLVAVTSTSAFISSTRSRNRHYVVIIACPEAISEAGLITCVKACGIAAAELAAGPVIRSAAPGIIIIVVIVIISPGNTSTITSAIPSTTYITFITTTHMIDLL
ncbi:MAG: hypothetical protein ACLR3P_11655 [Hungatella sp.]|uniref:hypothetical protein n=1 Tax=Hungatella sp. TaxID=2613924 RepID=UPI0039A35F9F